MNNGRIDPRVRERRRVEEAIFATLQGVGVEVSMLELLKRLGARGLSDEGIVKAAIARLLAESKLEMTRHRRIQLSSMAAGC